MHSDIAIAQKTKPSPIVSVAESLGIPGRLLELYGPFKAKLPLELIHRQTTGKLVLVSAITPTPAGEGKTTTSIGLADGLNRRGKKTTVVLREPSLGPIFGMKGGATGGGFAQVQPMEDINLHFTGDFAAVEKAHNLLAALVDNMLHHDKGHSGLDPRTIHLRRVCDMNDRALRQVIVGLGGKSHGVPRETGFDITAASEVMAILCLAEDLADLKQRLENIFIGFRHDRSPVYARDINAGGAMTVLLKDAVKPNLVQTLAGNPAIIHGGPFANIAQGTNSVIALRMALTFSDYVVTEAGFGFDLGAEKFFDIMCGTCGLSPHASVLVATVRALKYHGGVPLKQLEKPDPAAVVRGLGNLEKHLENMSAFGICSIVAVNRFAADTDEEVSVITQRCKDLGVLCAQSTAHAHGGAGAEDLAQKIIAVADGCRNRYTPLYDWNSPVMDKIRTIAQTMYGAKAIDYTGHAKKDLRTIKRLGLHTLPVCIAKTQKSLSDNPKLLGRPKDFVVTVREIQIASGAGFIIPITGDIVRMPGLPRRPAAESLDVDQGGRITGLS